MISTSRCIWLITLVGLFTIGLAALGQEKPSCRIFIQPEESLQEAIDRAPEGAVICLAEGTWYENIMITKSLILRGQGAKQSVIQAGEPSRPVIEMSVPAGAKDIYIGLEGLSIIEAWGWNGYGIQVKDIVQATITDCAISGNEHGGIELNDSSRATITGCNISENTEYGIRLWSSSHATVTHCTISGNSADGIRLSASAWAMIAGNMIQDNGKYGIESSSTRTVLGKGNHMAGNGADLGGNVSASLRLPLVEATEQEITYPDLRYGTLQEAVDALLPGGRLVLQAGEYEGGVTIAKELRIEASEGAEIVLRARNKNAPVLSLVEGSNAELVGLKLTGGAQGVRAGADAEVKITRCTISGNEAVGLDEYGGIALEDLSRATITRCTIPDNEDYGIELKGSARATITNCNISENRAYGIRLWTSSHASITGCTISNNSWHAVRLSGSAWAMIAGNTIEGNGKYGIESSSTRTVLGKGNHMAGNGADLGGNVSASLRLPLVEATEQEITYPGLRYGTLQEAVDALLPGGRLVLQAGEYEGGVTIAKELRIEASEGAETLVRAKNKDAPVLSLVGGASAELVGLKLCGGAEGVTLSANAGVRITRCTISENYYGISLSDFAWAEVIDCTVSDNKGDGLSLSESAWAEVTQCTISQNKEDGINITDSAQATITGCTISENTENGIVLWESSRATIIACTILENIENGIMLWYPSTQATITGCTISDNIENGIDLLASSQATITCCTISENVESGIEVKHSARVILRENRIINNMDYGIVLFDLQCLDTTYVFTGHIAGYRNAIPGPENADGNLKGATCPEELSFLMTEDGGELDKLKGGD